MEVGKKYQYKFRTSDSTRVYTCESKTKTGFLVSYKNKDDTLFETVISIGGLSHYEEYKEPRKLKIAILENENITTGPKVFGSSTEPFVSGSVGDSFHGFKKIDEIEWTEKL